MIYTIPRRKKERGMNVSSGAIYLYRFVFSLRARDTISLSGFPGAAIRGGFGHALKNSVCLADTRAVSCAPCAFAPSCAYAAVFESPNVGPADIMKKVTHRPHPFAMAPLFGRSAALESLLLAVSAVALNHPEVREIDINPIIISGAMPVAVDALIALGA